MTLWWLALRSHCDLWCSMGVHNLTCVSVGMGVTCVCTASASSLPQRGSSLWTKHASALTHILIYCTDGVLVCGKWPTWLCRFLAWLWHQSLSTISHRDGISRLALWSFAAFKWVSLVIWICMQELQCLLFIHSAQTCCLPFLLKKKKWHDYLIPVIFRPPFFSPLLSLLPLLWMNAPFVEKDFNCIELSICLWCKLCKRKKDIASLYM